MWQYQFSKESLKILEKLEPKTANLVKNKLKNLGAWLDNQDILWTDIKKLKGQWQGFYRLRIGPIRVLISINDTQNLIKVHNIGFRGDVY